MTRVRLLVRVLAVLLAFGGGFCSAWIWRGSIAAANLAAVQLQHEQERGQISQAVAAELAKREKQRQALQQQLDDIDQQHYGELRHAQEVNGQLSAQLAAARQRMRVPIVAADRFADVPVGTGSAGVDDGAQYADIQPAAAADLARLAADADACAVKLTALQARERARAAE